MKTAVNPLTRLALLAALAFALSPVHADPGADGPGRGRGGRDAGAHGRQWEQGARPPRQGQQGQRPEEPRGQRLSPEERQQLRRDIKDAGKEIYPAPRR